MYELVDDKNLWAETEIYPEELPYVMPGMKVKLLFPGQEETVLYSTVYSINPALSAGSNFATARIKLTGHSTDILPGMNVLAEAVMETGSVIAVPAAAVVTGGKGSRAWVREADGSFTPRDVETGMVTADSIEILSGLYEYDNVVISGAWLLDSEMILRKGTP